MQQNKQITIGSFDDVAKEFIDTWDKASHGNPVQYKDILMFDSIDTLLNVLTPKRFNILKLIHAIGHVSIRHTAKELDRQYAPVYRDIQALHQTDLILKDDHQKFYVPWHKLTVELRM